MNAWAFAVGLALGFAVAVAFAVDATDPLRGAVITDTTPPPPLQNSDNSDVRRARTPAPRNDPFLRRSARVSWPWRAVRSDC